MAESPDEAGGETAPTEVAYVLDALKTSFDEEFETGERLTSKARQVFALSAGFFTIVQTVAFSSFQSRDVAPYEKRILLAAAFAAILLLGFAALRAAQADSPIPTHRYPMWLLVVALNAIQLGKAPFPPENRRRDPNPDDYVIRPKKPPKWWKRLLDWLFKAPDEPPDFDEAEWYKQLLETPTAADSDAVDKRERRTLTRFEAPSMLANYYITLTQSRRLANQIRFEAYKRVRALAALSVIVTTAELMWSLYARLA